MLLLTAGARGRLQEQLLAIWRQNGASSRNTGLLSTDWNICIGLICIGLEMHSYPGMSGIKESGLKAILLIIAYAFVAVLASPASSADAMPPGSDVQSGHPTDYDSFNNSTIRFQSWNSLINTPVKVSAGNGYYANHPISYGSGIGSSTSIADRSSATFMHHEVGFGQQLSGEREITARESSYTHGDFESGRSTTINMRINENVTDGKVHIGVFQGGGDSGTGVKKNPRKNPNLEMEEDYIGTYHIYKNFTIDVFSRQVERNDSWLDCCPAINFDPYHQNSRSISTDEIFDYNFAESHRSMP